MVALVLRLMVAALCAGGLASCDPLRPTIEVLGDSISAYSAGVLSSTLSAAGDVTVTAEASRIAGEMNPRAGSPMVAVVELGANDVARGYAPVDTIAYLGLNVAGGYLQRGAVCVVFVTLPTTTGIASWDSGFAELNAWYRARPFVADYGAAADGDPTMTADRLHPSEVGKRMLAQRILDQVLRCLSNPLVSV